MIPRSVVRSFGIEFRRTVDDLIGNLQTLRAEASRVLRLRNQRSGPPLPVEPRFEPNEPRPMPGRTLLPRLVIPAQIGVIPAVAFSPDSQMIAAGSRDGMVKLWDVSSGKEACRFESRIGAISSLGFAPDGQSLEIRSSDGRVVVCAIPGGQYVEGAEPAPMTELGSGTAALRVSSRDGALTASSRYDTIIRLNDGRTDTERGVLLGHREGVSALAFHPGGHLLASGGFDRLVKVWDLERSVERLSLVGPNDWISCVAFSADGRRLAAGSEDRTIWIWELSRGRAELQLVGHRGGVRTLAFSPDGRHLVSASEDRSLALWSLQDAP